MIDLEYNEDGNSYGLMEIRPSSAKNKPTSTINKGRMAVSPGVNDLESGVQDEEILPENPLQTWGFNTPVSYTRNDDDKRVIQGEYNEDDDTLDLNVKGDKTVKIDMTTLKEEIKSETTLYWEEF